MSELPQQATGITARHFVLPGLTSLLMWLGLIWTFVALT